MIAALLQLLTALVLVHGAAAAPLPRVGDVLSERYRVDARLGEGGMAVVYAATELRAAERVAIKWMATGRREDAHRGLRLVREFEVLAGLDHPNIVRMHRIGRHRGRFYLVMELLEGETLDALIARGPVEVGEALAIAGGLLDALAALHARGVVHRDLKPANIMLAGSPTGGPPVPKLIDFGLAKKMDRVELSAPGALAPARAVGAELTRDGVALGTPLYMAPEQIEHASDVDGRADLYAVGVVLYQLLAAELPFTGESAEQVIAAVKAGAPVPLVTLRPALGQALSEAVMKALAREPDARHADASSFKAALQGSVSPLPPGGETGELAAHLGDTPGTAAPTRASVGAGIGSASGLAAAALVLAFALLVPLWMRRRSRSRAR